MKHTEKQEGEKNRMVAYETELQKAMATADYIPQTMQQLIPTFIYVGDVQDARGNTYYYYDKNSGRYYKEADIDREMRAAIKRNKRVKK